MGLLLPSKPSVISMVPVPHYQSILLVDSESWWEDTTGLVPSFARTGNPG
jgi:hypothetical protein